MGRNNYNQQASQDRSEKDCCGCKKFSWMLYILVLLSLALAILNFWMSLSTHEDIRLEMMDLKSDLTTLTQRLNSTKDDLRKSDLDKERFQKIMDDEVLIMKQELEILRTRHRQNQRHEHHPGDSGGEIAILRNNQKQIDEKIENLSAKLIGFDITNKNFLVEIDKSRVSQEGLRKIVMENKQEIDDIVGFQIKQQKISERIVEGESGFSEWNETFNELQDSVAQLSGKVRSNAAEIDLLRIILQQQEKSSESERLDRAEQRLLDLEGNEMKIKSDIRRLNQTSFNKFEEDTDEDERSQNLEYVSPQQLDHQDHANRNLAYDEDVRELKFRVSNLELYRDNLSESLKTNLTSVSEKLWSKIRLLEDQIVENRNITTTLEENLNKMNGKVKFLGQNLKQRTQN